MKREAGIRQGVGCVARVGGTKAGGAGSGPGLEGGRTGLERGTGVRTAAFAGWLGTSLLPRLGKFLQCSSSHSGPAPLRSQHLGPP